MPTYTVDAPLVSLRITDTPIGCRSPYGPSVPVTLSYTQNSDTQPSTQNFGNLGPHWYFNWVSYIQDNPLSPGINVVRVPMGGGAVTYTGNYHANDGSIDPDGFTIGSTRDRLYLTSMSPVRYELRMADGTIHVFSQSDSAATSPRKVFLTQVVDSRGNALTLTYDANQRLVQLTDAVGHKTTLQYNNANNALLITDIFDPFGRHAQVGYDTGGRLNSLTDVIGMTSTFTYDNTGIISAMTTPYGTTTFSFGGSAPNNWLNATDPLGMTERIEFNQGVSGVAFSDPRYPSLASRNIYPRNNWQNYRNVFFWDKTAYSQYPGDYSKARIQHLLHDGSNSSASNILESTKAALDNRILYLYPGLIDGGLRSGGTDLSWLTARLLPDGSTAVTEKTYNALGNVVRIIDPLGNRTTYTYASNLIDVLQISQTGSGGNDVVTATYTYNSQHLPLTYTDSAGLTITYVYNNVGQLTSATDSNGRVTTNTYDSNGYLLSTKRPDGIVDVRYTYDGVGRMASMTDAVGYKRSYSYDNLDRVTRITHPDGTHEENTWDKLDLVAYSNRAGQVTRFSYDAMRRRVTETNPLGQITKYSYYPGGQLKTKTDANGNAENWSYDVQSRVTSHTNALGQITNNSYDSAGRLSAIVDPTGKTTSLTYDASDRLTQEVLSATGATARVTTYSYTPDGQLKTVTSPDGSNTTFTYDSAFRLTAVTDTLGNSVNYTLDTLGNRIGEDVKDSTGSLQRSISRSFDSLNRLQRVVGAAQ